MATLLNSDLIGVILSSTSPTAVSTPSSTKLPSLPESGTSYLSSKSLSSSMFGISSSTLTLQTEAVSDLLQKVQIDMQVISYISKHSPALAALACLLCSPMSQIHPEMLSYAMFNSKVGWTVLWYNHNYHTGISLLAQLDTHQVKCLLVLFKPGIAQQIIRARQ